VYLFTNSSEFSFCLGSCYDACDILESTWVNTVA
jgi:hypothetical protein